MWAEELGGARYPDARRRRALPAQHSGFEAQGPCTAHRNSPPLRRPSRLPAEKGGWEPTGPFTGKALSKKAGHPGSRRVVPSGLKPSHLPRNDNGP